MRVLLTTFLMVCFSFTLVAPDTAYAKRFGGGSKLGKSYSAPKKVQPAQKDTSSQNAASTAAKPKKPGMMGGLLGGLLAGGLLGALLFGGAFEGIQIMDIILLAVLAFLAFKLFAMFRQKNPQQNPQPAYASPAPAPVDNGAHQFTPMSAASSSQLKEAQLELPDWFNKVAFLEGGKEHFTRLQAAWDRQDWTEIGSYTSADMLAQLQQERQKYPAEQHTRVESVMAELINFIDQSDQVIASIHFYGWIIENGQSQPTEFSEIWHLSRDMTEENAHWYIVGIEQPQ